MTESDTVIRPRRSMLYVPASNRRAIDKAAGLPADMVAFDLEDSVAPDVKATARTALFGELAARTAAGRFGGRELLVRINGLATSWAGDDLAACAASGIDAVLVPKVTGPADVAQTIRLLGDAGAAIAVWCMMETAAGILAADAIAAASPRVAGFAVGLNDLGRELQARQSPGREAFLASLGLIVLAARAHGLAAIDSPFIDLNDEAGLAAHCEQGRRLGFDGCSVIHPRQIDVANRSYSPSATEIARARKVIDVHEAAQAEGRGVAVLDGKLVENLHVVEARRVLALAAAATG